MISTESMKYSLKNLMMRKSRSLFTILSIFVGITTIFIFISFGWGLYDYVNEISSESSADKVLIQAKGSGAPGLDDTFKLTEDDLEAVRRTKGVFDASGVYFKPVKITQNRKSLYSFLISYDPKKPLLMESYNIGIDKGRLLESGDNGKALLGYNYQLADKIFSKPYKINDKIEVKGQKLTVVGFFEPIGNPQDDSQVYVTNDFMEKLYADDDLSYAILVAKVDTRDIKQVIDRIEKSLREERGLEEGNEDFFVTSYEDLLDAYMSALNIVIGFVILIALISVVVSAVNTANTMITSVLERFKEIGILKSIGARNSEIFRIFLFESSFLGFIAGIVGIFFGWLITYIIDSILNSLGWGFLSPHYSFLLFAGCVLFAMITGAISGVLPAVQASKLKPVDALRYE